MAERAKLTRKPIVVTGFDKDVVADLAFKVYKVRLGRDAVKRTIEDPKKGVRYLKDSAQSYAPIVRAFLEVLRDEGVTLPDGWMTETER